MANKKVKQKKGLGDMVETIAKPIAKAIDSVAGTDIEHCEGCEKRKNFMNKLGMTLQHLYSGRPMREPSQSDLEYLVKFFEGNQEEGARYWQRVLVPMNNRLFYRKDKLTNCKSCWARIEGRLKLIYDEWKAETE